ncbi:hypothetical protein KVF89_05120 [Nocardioides carbamazepini]|uniref:DUF7660 family protein n=1 Tax=Nocardioides carbamazepini TaxID=2854259 RepID=UPI00214A1219|nr:hypothetical protein [Nocardioides carbamazepini]MCR1781909.1 hypothetical protein [Nocardioides carbamazepini]
MEISSVGDDVAEVRLSRAEVLAIRNITERAEMVPFELRGPHQIFERLAAQFGAVAESMGDPSWATGRATHVEPESTTTRDEFGDFVLGVLADFSESGRSEWENNTLERFLDGLSAFALARVNGRSDGEQEQPSWNLFAELIVAATGYE